jgi:hypothetical protein
MESNPTQDLRQAHELLDMLPGDKIAAIRTLLEAVIEPSYTIVSAPTEE